jgi:hypothetical protein
LWKLRSDVCKNIVNAVALQIQESGLRASNAFDLIESPEEIVQAGQLSCLL